MPEPITTERIYDLIKELSEPMGGIHGLIRQRPFGFPELKRTEYLKAVKVFVGQAQVKGFITPEEYEAIISAVEASADLYGVQVGSPFYGDVSTSLYPRYTEQKQAEHKAEAAKFDIETRQGQEARARWEHGEAEKAKMRTIQAEQAQRVTNVFAKAQEKGRWAETIRNEAAAAAAGATISNEQLKGLLREAQGIGVDLSWVQPRLERLAYDARMGRVTGVQGRDPQLTVFAELRQQVVKRKREEDETFSKQLKGEYPKWYQRFERLRAAESEEAFEGMSSEEQDIIQGLAGKERFMIEPGGTTKEGERLLGEVEWAGQGSFAQFAKQTPAFQEAITQRETQRFTDFPSLYPQYQAQRTAESPVFESWLETDPYAAAFQKRKKTPVTQGRITAPRHSPFRQV